MESKEIKSLMEAYASIYEHTEEAQQLDEISDRRVQGMLAKREKQDRDSGGISAGYMANRRAQQAAARRNARTGSNVKVDPILSKEEVEALDEAGLPYGPVGRGFKKLPPGKKREAMMKRADALRTQAMKDDGDGGKGSPRGKMGEINDALTNPRLREETDLFDYILEHLVAEGYADTNKAALAIMANMSEEWKNSIIEDVYTGPIKRQETKPKPEGGSILGPGRSGDFGKGYGKSEKPIVPPKTSPANPGSAEGGTGLPPGQVPPNVRRYASGG